MEGVIFDKNFKIVPPIIDTFMSFIWTERFNTVGDFEVVLPVNPNTLLLANRDNAAYIYLKESDEVMVIENFGIDTDVEDGNTMTISGRSLQSILERRIVWNRTVVSGDLQAKLKQLFNENIISPAITKRKIDNFIFVDSINPTITNFDIEAEFFGEDMLEVVEAICSVYDIGFRLIFKDGKLRFFLYDGEDRSYDQMANPFVVFSPGYDNLMNTNYYASTEQSKNVVVVVSDEFRKNVEGITDISGLDRRETFLESHVEESADELELEGLELLAEQRGTELFEGETLNLGTFTYGKDYFLGDIVQIMNEFGIMQKVRITEIIRTHDASGESIYPTFMAVE